MEIDITYPSGATYSVAFEPKEKLVRYDLYSSFRLQKFKSTKRVDIKGTTDELHFLGTWLLSCAAKQKYEESAKGK